MQEFRYYPNSELEDEGLGLAFKLRSMTDTSFVSYNSSRPYLIIKFGDIVSSDIIEFLEKEGRLEEIT